MSEQGMASKPSRESYVEMTEIVQPGDTNSHGTMFGGRVVSLMDVAAATAALRHCRMPVVTASIDRVDFHAPVRQGFIVGLRAAVNYTARTSLEIGVRVESEDPLTGERRHTASAYLTFVALDQKGRPTPIPAVVPETEIEKKRFVQGEARRAERVEQRAAEKPCSGDE